MPQRKYQPGGKRAMRKLEDRQQAGEAGSGDAAMTNRVEGHEDSEDDCDGRVPEAVAGMQPLAQSEDEGLASGDDLGQDMDEEAMANQA